MNDAQQAPSEQSPSKRTLESRLKKAGPGTDALLVAGLLTSGGSWYWAQQLPGSCRRFQFGASFAGITGRFASWVTAEPGGCALTARGAYGGLAAAAAIGAVFAVLAAAAVYRWWPTAGNTWAQRVAVLWMLPLAVGVLEVLQRATITVAIWQGDLAAPRLWGPGAWLAPAFSWPKSIGLGFSVVLLVSLFGSTMLGRAARQRESFRPEMREQSPTPSEAIGGLGIACSGGGIRAGSVTLGVLAYLEQAAHPSDDGRTVNLLRQARYVSSVSGGGYTSGAWFNATGSPAWDAPLTKDDQVHGRNPTPGRPMRVIGGVHGRYTPPKLYDEDQAVANGQTLIRHVATRHQFLRTGPGGITRSIVVAAGFLLLHLSLLAATAVAVGWPAGRLARSWPLIGGTPCDLAEGSPTLAVSRCAFTARGLQYDYLAARHIAPIVVFGTLGTLLWLATFSLARTRMRSRLRTAGTIAYGAAVLPALFALGGPLLLDVLYPVFRSGIAGTITIVTGLTGFAATVYALVVKTVKKYLVALCGYLSMALLAGFGLYVAGNAAVREGPFGLTIGALLSTSTPVLRSDLFVYAAALGVYGAIVPLLEPRWWSLHTIYRRRLRFAFATTTRWPDSEPWVHHPKTVTTNTKDDPADRGVTKVWPRRRHGERPLDAFVHPNSGNGPMHLICCTAARRPRTGTGIKGESFVISPQTVRLYEYDDESADIRMHEIDTASYLACLPRPLRPESMWTAVSGAAVAPSLGRLARGSLGTALATLNLRLGVWLPNPRWVRDGADTSDAAGWPRFPRPGARSLVKEILGAWSVDDKHLYVTDGGHWENLGLVELLRRRCRTIICIDASGDKPGSFATLLQAARLAELQAHAHIRDLPTPTTDTEALPDRSHYILPVDYYDKGDGGTIGQGTIVYLPARVWATASPSIRAFAAEDHRFPHYSTGDQLLTIRQHRHLVEIGYELANAALNPTHPEGLDHVLAALPPDDPDLAPARTARPIDLRSIEAIVVVRSDYPDSTDQ